MSAKLSKEKARIVLQYVAEIDADSESPHHIAGEVKDFIERHRDDLSEDEIYRELAEIIVSAAAFKNLTVDDNTLLLRHCIGMVFLEKENPVAAEKYWTEGTDVSIPEIADFPNMSKQKKAALIRRIMENDGTAQDWTPQEVSNFPNMSENKKADFIRRIRGEKTKEQETMSAKKTKDTFTRKSPSQATFEAVAAATGLTAPEAPAQDHTQTAAAPAVSDKPRKTGRPPITDPSAKKSKRLPLMLRQETFDRLKAAADAREIPVSQLVTSLIMDFLKDEGGR